MAEERLQKVLARAGVGSRRACEGLIASGRVTVDGQLVTKLGTKVDPARAEIRVDGRPIAGQRHRYIMLHKPAGYISGRDRRAGYPSCLDLVRVPERLFSVGRLDQDSEGLLLLTNDGELAHRLTHPRYEHPKTYLVEVKGVPNPRKLRRLQHGVMLRDGRTAPAEVSLLRRPPEPLAGRPALDQGGRGGGRRVPRTSWLKITLREGRKRQIRRMVSLLGHPALRVVRVGLGPLQLADLPSGKWRTLTAGEVKALKDLVAGDDARQVGSAAGQERSPRERNTIPLMPSTIAIDGPAASGKSTIGGLLAKELDYLYLDTGVMYRAIAWLALARGLSIEDEAGVTELAHRVRLDVQPPTVDDGRDVTVLADGEDITWELRRPEVEHAVSPVSAYAGVRQALTQQQRRIGRKGRIVMVGRDIGTVVLPDADLKIYLDASARVRAERRYRERLARGEVVDLDDVLGEIRRRDRYDSSREYAPLAAAADAIILDSTALTIDEVMSRVRGLLEHWARKRPGQRGLPKSSEGERGQSK